MSQGPPPQLKEFIRNAGVNVQQQQSQQRPQQQQQQQQQQETVNNNLINFIVSEADPEKLELQLFHAKVNNIIRPENIVQYVQQLRLSPDNQDGIKVVEVSAHYGQMQTGLKRSINFNYTPKVNPAIKNKVPAWTYVQFKLIVENDVTVIVKVYKDLMLLQGQFVKNKEDTPYKVANHVLNRYLAGQTMIDKTLEFSYVEGKFEIPKQFNSAKMNAYLRQKHGFVTNKVSVTRRKVDPFVNEYDFYGNASGENLRGKKSKNAFYEFKRFGQPVIYSISGKGVVKVRGKTISAVKGNYETAKQIIKNYITQPNAPTMNAKPRTVAKKKKRNVANFDANAAVTNLVIGKKMCKDYAVTEIKSIAKVLGIQVKGEKKGEICKKIDDTLKGQRNAVKAEALPGNVNLRKQNLYKKRGINNASIRNMLRKAKSTNITGNLKKVKNMLPTLKANKKDGIPFKAGVKNAVKRVVKERETIAYARTALNRYTNLNNATKNMIVQRVKNLKTTKEVNASIKRNVDIARLKVAQVKKNKIYEELKNKKNVNVNAYAGKYTLIEEYSKGFRNSVQVRKNVLEWLRGKNSLPTNEEVKNKIVHVFNKYDRGVNKQLLNRRYTKKINEKVRTFLMASKKSGLPPSAQRKIAMQMKNNSRR